MSKQRCARRLPATALIDNVGDGVGVPRLGIAAEFPFLPTPHDGRNRRHVDPGDPA
jgi:hypothetical protein